jgi:hypothetical protein
VAALWIVIAFGPESPLVIFSLFLGTASWFLFFAMEAALFRLALGSPEKGAIGLSLGADEMRLFAVYLLIGLVSAVVLLVVSLLLVIAMSAVLAAGIDPELLKEDPNLAIVQSGPQLLRMMIGGGVFVYAILFYLLARFAPAFPAAIGEQKVRIFEAAAWTKGQGLRIVAAMLITLLPFFVASLPAMWITLDQMGPVMEAYIANPDAEPPTALITIPLHWRLLPILVAPALSAVRAGLFSTIYRGLRPA